MLFRSNHQPTADSFFDVYFEVELMPGAPNIDPSLPVLRTTTNGQFIGGPVGTQPATWGEVKSLYQK